jgi:hypothetical protein
LSKSVAGSVRAPQYINHSRHSAACNVAFFIALLATAVAMAGAGAHALELPNKVGMGAQEYFVAQQLYRGWNRLGYVLAAELVGMLAVIVLYRKDRRVLRPAALSLAALVAAQAIFWIWTFPANQATSDWMVQPENWEALRSQWEYSHLAGAGFQLLAMAALIVAVLKRR